LRLARVITKRLEKRSGRRRRSAPTEAAVDITQFARATRVRELRRNVTDAVKAEEVPNAGTERDLLLRAETTMRAVSRRVDGCAGMANEI